MTNRQALQDFIIFGLLFEAFKLYDLLRKLNFFKARSFGWVGIHHH
jgi:hypothetical protein